MKTYLVGCLLFLTTLGASAEAQIKDVEISREGDQVNIRVKLHNPGPKGDRGPIVVDLWGRANSQDEWLLLKSWSDGFKLPRGYKLSRDFFSSPGTDGNSFLQGNFQVSAALRSESSGANSRMEKSFP